MKKCELCQEDFPASFVENGIVKSLQRRKFCLKCSPYKQHNTKNLKLAQEGDELVSRQCTKCGLTKTLDDFYFNSGRGKKYRCCKKCLSQYAIDKHRNIKLRAIEYKGGACVVCGYMKCARSLVFHHIDESDKDFTISHDTSRSWKKIRDELDKCVLLCGNCHNEVHAGLTQLP